MNVDVFDPLPPTLYQNLVPFSGAQPMRKWSDVYRMISFLYSQFPGASFRSEPYHYLDLKHKRFGLVFIENESEQLYFVYEGSSAKHADIT
jgi:hypothetical protein